MPIIYSEFKAPLYIRNPHIQTLWPALMRNPPLPKRRVERLNLSDGDFLELDIVEEESVDTEPVGKNFTQHRTQNTNKQQANAVLLIHGLSGSSDSQYIVGLQSILKQHGVTSIAMNFRGAKSPNNLAKGYHSGSSDDITEICTHLSTHYANLTWHAIGFSLGGNVLLKFLGEHPQNLFRSALAVSVPLQLDICSTRLDQGLSRLYRNHLLKSLKEYLHKKHQHLQQVNPEQAKLLASVPIDKKFSSFWELDHEIIAPIHGFDSAQDYYQRCSSRQFLKSIQTPCRILNALDDPFFSKDIIPDSSEFSDNITLELSQNGGHVGFYQGKQQYFIENLVLDLVPHTNNTDKHSLSKI